MLVNNVFRTPSHAVRRRLTLRLSKFHIQVDNRGLDDWLTSSTSSWESIVRSLTIIDQDGMKSVNTLLDRTWPGGRVTRQSNDTALEISYKMLKMWPLQSSSRTNNCEVSPIRSIHYAHAPASSRRCPRSFSSSLHFFSHSGY
jgi:hypothetical protein